MSRPLRIEYPGAWYHVMNRGLGRQKVFLSDNHRETFLTLLGDVQSRYAIEIHAYCLMDNHYHLLAHTPEGGLKRGLRHLNSVYTQSFNRSTGRDGALFRGRYKAILIEKNSYLLQVSRYIHRNPHEAGKTEQADNVLWSSYPYYIRRLKPPPWLYCAEILGALQASKARYRAFVGQSVDAELTRFYHKKKLSPILGSNDFIRQIKNKVDIENSELADARRLQRALDKTQIIQAVAVQFDLDAKILTAGRRPRGEITVARNLAMLLCQSRGRMTLSELARTFKLGHYTSVSTAIGDSRRRLQEDKRLRRHLQEVEKQLDRLR